ncbi:MAG: hypothetical protein II829_02130 [Bacteroidales bacterium]|nr:hypothetical protein [Bacteroidales bacterium]
MRPWWGIVMMLLLAACTSHKNGDAVETRRATSLPTDVSPELSAIDSLMWQRPDSALTCLLPYFDTCCRDGVHTVSTTHDCHYANLLLAELLYKNDNPQLNRAELLQAVDYYDSLYACTDVARNVSTNAFLDARAHYINGVGYYERDSVVEACQEYLKALEVMEDSFDEAEIIGNKANLMALLFAHLTDEFSDQYLHEQSIYFGKKSLKYFKKYDAISWNVSWVLNEIGSHYDVLGDYDSAGYYYNQGLFLLSDTNNLNYRDLTTRLAFLSYKKEKDPILSLNQLFSMLSQAESKQEFISRCLTIGEIYYHEKEFDSAWLYLNNVYDQSQNIGAKKQAAEWLVEICKAQNNMQDMHKFAEFLVPFANQEENNSGTRSQLTELYNRFKQKELEQKQHHEKKKQATLILLVFGGMLMVILFVIFLYRKNKQGKQKLETQIKAERHMHKMQQAALAGRLKRSNAALKEQDKKVIIAPTNSSVNKQIVVEKYAEEPICRQILDVCNDKNKPIKSSVPVSAYKDIALSDAQKAQLKEAAIRHYSELFNELKRNYPELKEKDLFYCYLCLLGLDNVQIAAMTQLSYRTIWEREKRLQQLFHTEGKMAIILNEMLIA